MATPELHPNLLLSLAARSGKIVDLAYSALVHKLGITDRFFPKGFGQLEAIDMHGDFEMFRSWPPPHFQAQQLDWQRIKRGTVGSGPTSAAYAMYRGSFRTPATGRVYDALPLESRTAQALWIVPDVPAEGAPCVVHLAATGDHGFVRRVHLGLPLVQQGIATLALESPFYGVRKPPDQAGAKLHRVSDLLLLGRATIEESLLLLNWLSEEGRTKLGMCGLSMGGVHASMTAALYPGQCALTPLLAPRSAAVAYCGGALYHATHWHQLHADAARRQSEILSLVREAARASVAGLSAARVHDLVHGSGIRSSASKDDASLLVAPEMQPPPEQQQQQWTQALDVPALNLQQADQRPESGGVNNGVASALSSTWQSVGHWMGSWGASLAGQIGQVARMEREKDHEGAVLLLQQVLETWTDVTRFPKPQRPDAAVLVGATDDLYVSRESILELHRHLPGSEVRWVPGGHVSSFLLHHGAFRKAIVDSLARLDNPPPVIVEPEQQHRTAAHCRSSKGDRMVA